MSRKRGAASARRSVPQPGRGARQGRRGTALVFGAVLFALAAMVAAVFAASPGQQTAVATGPVQNADRIDVVYFHRTERCESCLWAARMARKTVETHFATQLANGKVTFREVDVQRPENRTMAYKHRASGSQLFVNYVSGDQERIVEARQTYPFVGNEARFSEALRKMIASGMGGS